MIYKLSVDIVRDFLDDKKRKFDDLLRLKRWKGTENFCWAIRQTSVPIRKIYNA
jgi:hypothetical protein